jgi:hypothetical protein
MDKQLKDDCVPVPEKKEFVSILGLMDKQLKADSKVTPILWIRSFNPWFDG